MSSTATRRAASGASGFRAPTVEQGLVGDVAKVFAIISAADPSIGQIPQNHLARSTRCARPDRGAEDAYFFDLVLGARDG